MKNMKINKKLMRNLRSNPHFFRLMRRVKGKNPALSREAYKSILLHNDYLGQDSQNSLVHSAIYGTIYSIPEESRERDYALIDLFKDIQTRIEAT